MKSKGVIRVIDICMKLKNKDVLFLIIGDGPERKNILKKIKRYNLSNEIKLLGFKKNPKDYFKISDMTLITSHYEGFGMTVLESLKEKTPVIAPSISGIIDIYEEIAPLNSMKISKNTNDDLIEKIKEELKQTNKNQFEFDLKEYNKKIKQKYMDIVLFSN